MFLFLCYSSSMNPSSLSLVAELELGRHLRHLGPFGPGEFEKDLRVIELAARFNVPLSVLRARYFGKQTRLRNLAARERARGGV